MIPPQNLPFAAFILQLSRADRSFSRLDQQLVETPTSLSDFSPCSSVTFLPSVGTEFTEYKCQSVYKKKRPPMGLRLFSFFQEVFGRTPYFDIHPCGLRLQDLVLELCSATTRLEQTPGGRFVDRV